jgi:hypothetical protein
MARAVDLIRMSLQDLGVLGAGESARGEDMADGLRRLQFMISAWAFDPLTSLQIQREEFILTPGKSSYTVGLGLDIQIERPVSQNSIVGAGIILNAGQPNEVETSVTVLTDDQYQGIAVKGQDNALFRAIYYRPGAPARTPVTAIPPLDGIPYGEILIWPVPTQANPLVLYIKRMVPNFHDLTTDYPIPPGFISTIQYNLTVALAPMFQVEPSSELVRQARLSYAAMKRNNYPMSDIAIDPMFTMQTPGAGWDINTGSTRRS